MNDVRLVLLSCCAPCSASAINQIISGIYDKKPAELNISDFIVLFYNPNIYPEIEYQKRLAEQIKYCESVDVKYAILEYNHDEWLATILGHEGAPERGSRCALCFAMRFARAQIWALENGYNAIASVLGKSRHKNQDQVNAAAESVISAIKYLDIKWDADTANTDYGFYRQNYCGCEFSIRK